MFKKGDKVVDGGVGPLNKAAADTNCKGEHICATLHPSEFTVCLKSQPFMYSLNKLLTIYSKLVMCVDGTKGTYLMLLL